MNISRKPGIMAIGRCLVLILLWSAVLISLVISVNAIGIHMVGSLQAWEEWLASNTGYFLLWRLCLYGLTVFGWLWMRRRLLAREQSLQPHHRLLRTEIAAVAVIVVLEGSLLLQAG